MIEIFQIDSIEFCDKYYVVLDETEEKDLVLSELTLDGKVSQESIILPPDAIKLAGSLSAPWKAAYMVWKNACFLEQNKVKEEDRYRKKVIELLALKYNVDSETLFKILDELEDLD